MGRKSQKAKDKKQKRKEEQIKLAAAQVVVDAANNMEDPMEKLSPFRKYEKNGLLAMIECQRVTDLDRDTQDWVFNLLTQNMQSLYESSNWGWKEREKRDEMTDERAWYLIAKDGNSQPIGFVHFRFDIDFDDEVLYCYEIQLTTSVRRKGLGKFLMQILEMIAFQTNMKKVMLTVFKMNDKANKFFNTLLKYEIDETSPSIFDPMNPEDYDYEILSKPVKKKVSSSSAKE